MMKASPIWSGLEKLATPAAVLAEWQQVLGTDFEWARPFLRPTDRQALDYPCTREPKCGCRHEVVPRLMVAACRCEERDCASIRLEPKDVLVYELDMRRVGEGIQVALGFDAPRQGNAASGGENHVWPVGTYARTHSPVILALCLTEGLLLEKIEGLIDTLKEPFILLTPSHRNHSAAVQSALKGHRCESIPLGKTVALAGKGKFKATASIQPILDRFIARLASQETIKPVLEGIHRAITAGHEERRNLAAAKTRLEQMQGEGLFGFVKKIDRETLDLFFSILASGDLAKASRALEMKDSTLRSKVAGWRRRGKAYAALAEFVRWRKSINGQAGIDYAKRLASGAERTVDHAALVRDTLEALESFNPDNWEEKCAELQEALRAAVS